MFRSLLVLLALGSVSVLQADETKSDLPIGLIDVGYIFKNYKPAADTIPVSCHERSPSLNQWPH